MVLLTLTWRGQQGLAAAARRCPGVRHGSRGPGAAGLRHHPGVVASLQCLLAMQVLLQGAGEGWLQHTLWRFACGMCVLLVDVFHRMGFMVQS